jgi:hypothetical protein
VSWTVSGSADVLISGSADDIFIDCELLGKFLRKLLGKEEGKED